MESLCCEPAREGTLGGGLSPFAERVVGHGSVDCRHRRTGRDPGRAGARAGAGLQLVGGLPQCQGFPQCRDALASILGDGGDVLKAFPLVGDSLGEVGPVAAAQATGHHREAFVDLLSEHGSLVNLLHVFGHNLLHLAHDAVHLASCTSLSKGLLQLLECLRVELRRITVSRQVHRSALITDSRRLLQEHHREGLCQLVL
mmetsp:Transcript_128568/g.287471  ORF Transcript_128568/g.287471 Transcript_128568/m.287471 type:complete len:200 (+) Transcript_128568:458-1057(+)